MTNIRHTTSLPLLIILIIASPSIAENTHETYIYSSIALPNIQCKDVSSSLKPNTDLRELEVSACDTEVIKYTLYEERQYYQFIDNGISPRHRRNFGPYPEKKNCTDRFCSNTGLSKADAKALCNKARDAYIESIESNPVSSHFICYSEETASQFFIQPKKLTNCVRLSDISKINSHQKQWLCKT